ncbi:MAG: hypothetical protein Q9225_007144 [Loekoesia sp. 1 TL-2023]
MTSATSRLSSFLPHRGHRAQTCRQRPLHKPNSGGSKSLEEQVIDNDKPDVGELRRRRTDFYNTTPEDRRIKDQRPMAERTTPRRSSSARIPSGKRPEIIIREVREPYPPEHRHRRHKPKGSDLESEPENVYVYRSKPSAAEPPSLHRSKTTRTSHKSRPKEARRSSEGLTRSHTVRPHSHLREDETIVRRVVSVNHHPESINRAKSHRSRPSVTRSSSVRETASVLPPRPSLHRSQTTTRKVQPAPRAAPPPPPIREKPELAPSGARGNQRSSGFFGSILGIPKAPSPPEKQ